MTNQKSSEQLVRHFEFKYRKSTNPGQIRLLFLMIAVFSLIFTIGTVDANTLYVPEEYQTISLAITAAFPGDSVIVHPGIFHENVVINKKLSLIGEGLPIIAPDNGQQAVLVTAENVIIKGFRIINPDFPGIVVKSNGITLSDMEISDTPEGIKLLKSSDSTIKNTTIKNQNFVKTNFGIHLSNSPRTTITHNYLENLGEGIYLDRSSPTNINNNIFKNCSLRVVESYKNVVSNNIVNGKPLVYLDNQKGGTVTNAGQVILINCDGITIRDNTIHDVSTAIFLFKSYNVLITNNNILNGTWGAEVNEYGDGIILKYSSALIKNNNFVDNWEGIQLSDSSANEISDNIFTNNVVGILLDNSSQNKVRNNAFIDCGIDVRYSYDNDVTGNIINDKPLVYLENKHNMEVTNAGQVILVNSQGINVKNNRISRTTAGVKLWNSSDNFITDNLLSENFWGGIALWYSLNNTVMNNTANKNDDGIHLAYSSENTIQNNTVNNNRLYGISLFSSPRNEISYNSVTNSGLFGFTVRSSPKNVIYFNDFVDNPSPQVMADTSKNSWNSTDKISYIYNNKGYISPVGNYFSDRTSPDIDNNGIRDKSYRINLPNVDYYPRIKPLGFYTLPRGAS